MNHRNTVEKRKKRALTESDKKVLRSLFVKALVPISAAILLSSAVLLLGIKFLMTKASFGNYGLNPAGVSSDVSRFISTYAVIAAVNIVIMLSLSVTILYLMLHEIVLPLLRITREALEIMSKPDGRRISVRQTDYLLVPLAGIINKLIYKD
ncbi:MAG TPA: hypothetical protein DEE98_03885 [Elusimicrobia bacterium]|nr:MAG: hypothetical protein A2278_01215 [Elusimicrobia bacterium RIFOXYA12_FULL_49_49]OGS08337.1 MAG: hypothetical protein A2204_03575 [Elusimicrobia bacterium RIFOXYA1_FULL_47_7]OGS09807.1 MAG: hypothetical protein A2386_07835 [Elusimicrobia bacterium RIFOXYB1_FULL_48_9]OGS15816.1 MAG: hypothetical protein A2251_04115 [Elusimicrobia bacterium RIFOXYA2_FULL_47_53]OGS26004.1 MAG: hypothetical protein A2339_05505 [Elusimicrobia bacterium RIFOXYB12_FULL_50_12]OGS31148.1 MAG: hypothetical protein